MDDSSSSKVTVEYHDPSGVFRFVSRDIFSRLPLRNLNWQPQARPLRQIKALHLDFVPDAATQELLRSHARPSESAVSNDHHSSLDLAHGGSKKGLVKERRHQIPGLQTSPYLKLYVLRCDDRESYKATERKKLREWIRNEAEAVSAKAKRNGKGEDHDAFEWLILHVVVPDTVAASESRWRVSTKDADELKERKQGSKWPGKSGRTVFDKLRSDFNESGKNTRDRVAQIRLLKDQMPGDLLPTPPAATTVDESADERQRAWNDLTTKFRNLILASFDRRVRCYEADIAEQDSRRSLPGFNFCTFFIHKEGLARAFESIGLVEDALVIYDELALGLEIVQRDLSSGQSEGTATTFAPFTDDIVDRIVALPTRLANGAWHNVERDDDEPGLFVKDYREKIVTSTISVFDFNSYLFTRQKALILRLANAKAARAGLGVTNADGGEDLVLTSEVCWRGSYFIHNNARTLRQDLRTNKSLSNASIGSEQDIEALVSSWVYIVADEILVDTAATMLDQKEHRRRSSLANGSVVALRRSELSFAGLGANPYPQRTTSLSIRKGPVDKLQRKQSLKSASESDIKRITSQSREESNALAQAGIDNLPGMPELVTYRAELVMLKRKMLEHVAKQRGWLTGWAKLQADAGSRFDEIDLSENGNDSSSDSRGSIEDGLAPSNMLAPALATVLQVEKDFWATYEDLSKTAMQYFISATLTKSAEAIMGDLAILKFQQGEFEYTAKVFQHILSLYSNDGWNLREARALLVYAKCLNSLLRTDEYIKVSLSLLRKVCARKDAQRRQATLYQAFDEENIDVHGLFSELVAASVALPSEIPVQLDEYFSQLEFDPLIRHHIHDKSDGFSLRFALYHHLDEHVDFDMINARLVNMEDSNQEIWLSSDHNVTLVPGSNPFILRTTTVASGLFYVALLEFRAKKLKFVKEFPPHPLSEANTVQTNPEYSSDESKSNGLTQIYVYPSLHSLAVDVELDPLVEIGKPRSLRLRIDSGWNSIDTIDLKIKPASAGLRLHSIEAETDSIDRLVMADPNPGQIQLGSLARQQSAWVKVPFSLEHAADQISVRLEVVYHTRQGEFKLISAVQLSTSLYLDVHVDDIFHLDTLFSVFTLRTTGCSPLYIRSATLKHSSVYDVQAPPLSTTDMLLLDSQHVQLVFKITKKSEDNQIVSKKDAALGLQVCFQPVDRVLKDAFITGITDCLEKEELEQVQRLLLPFAAQRFQKVCSEQDYNMAAQFGEIQMPTYAKINWDVILAYLPEDLKSQFSSILLKWHEQHSSLKFDAQTLSSGADSCVAIVVEVPHIDFVHSAAIVLAREAHQDPFAPQIVVIGHPITCRLRLKSTQQWNERGLSIQTPKRCGAKVEFMDFVYDVQAEPDTWLIGGPRRVHFTANCQAEQVFDLVLVPLRLGILPLPIVDVQAANTTGTTEATLPAVKCQVQYESAGQVVHVIRGLQQTRVGVPNEVS